MAKKNRLQDWEVAMIRAMLSDGQFSKQQIVSYFSRPDRSINQGRISEIQDNHEHYRHIKQAPPEEYAQFMEEWEQVAFPAAPKIDYGPVHPVTLKALFPAKPLNSPEQGTGKLSLNEMMNGSKKLVISETDIVEGKESFNWGSKETYAKTMVGFANNRGGYLLFGVVDLSFEIVGIKPDRMEKFDLKKANQYLSRTFTQALRIESGSFAVNGKTVGAFYVHPSIAKPVICKNDGGGLFSGDIYYRYPGESRCIQAPELEILLRDRDHVAGQNLLNIAQQVQSIGPENVAMMNLKTGAVDGEKGRFFISEDLLPSLKFIKEGKLEDADGAPTLKLIGELQTLSGEQVTIERKVKDSISERDIIDDFLRQEDVGNPTAYISQLCHIQPVYLPIYYYAHLANLNVESLAGFLEKVHTPYADRVKKQIARISGGNRATVLPARADFENFITAIKGQEAITVQNIAEARKYLKAIRLLTPDEVEIERVLAVLLELYSRFGNSKDTRSDFRYAIADVDLMWFRPKLQPSTSTA